jgi:hypothetical protein
MYVWPLTWVRLTENKQICFTFLKLLLFYHDLMLKKNNWAFFFIMTNNVLKTKMITSFFQLTSWACS